MSNPVRRFKVFVRKNGPMAPRISIRPTESEQVSDFIRRWKERLLAHKQQQIESKLNSKVDLKDSSDESEESEESTTERKIKKAEKELCRLTENYEQCLRLHEDRIRYELRKKLVGKAGLRILDYSKRILNENADGENVEFVNEWKKLAEGYEKILVKKEMKKRGLVNKFKPESSESDSAESESETNKSKSSGSETNRSESNESESEYESNKTDNNEPRHIQSDPDGSDPNETKQNETYHDKTLCKDFCELFR